MTKVMGFRGTGGFRLGTPLTNSYSFEYHLHTNALLLELYGQRLQISPGGLSVPLASDINVGAVNPTDVLKIHQSYYERMF